MSRSSGRCAVVCQPCGSFALLREWRHANGGARLRAIAQSVLLREGLGGATDGPSLAERAASGRAATAGIQDQLCPKSSLVVEGAAQLVRTRVHYRRAR